MGENALEAIGLEDEAASVTFHSPPSFMSCTWK